MRWFDRFKIRMVLYACITLVVLASLYLAWEPYLGSYIGYFQTGSAAHDGRWNARVNLANELQDLCVSSGSGPAASLPDGWQTDWKGGKLWITHYNPDGTVADALPFDGLGDFYQWFESHPDCCDVNVGKLGTNMPEAAVCARNDAPDTACPASTMLTQ